MTAAHESCSNCQFQSLYFYLHLQCDKQQFHVVYEDTLSMLPFTNVDDIIEQDPANDNPLQNMSSHGEPTIKFPRKTNQKECTIALLNVNSLPSKLIEIKEWLVDGVFDILCIQETKIDSTFPNSQFHVNGYSIFR